MNLNLFYSAVSLLLVQFTVAEEKAANMQASATSDKTGNPAWVIDGTSSTVDDGDVLKSIQSALDGFRTTVDDRAKKFEKGMVILKKVKSSEDIQKLSDAKGDFSALSNEYAKIVQDFQNAAWTEFSKLQEYINLILSDLPKGLESLRKPLEVIKFAAVSCPGCSYSIYRYVRSLERLIGKMKEASQADFSKDVGVFSNIYQRCARNLRYAPHTVDFSEVLSPENGEEAEAEDKTKKETEDKAKKEAEDKAKKETEDKAKKEAEDKAKKETEDKAKKEAEDKAKKETEDKAKKEAEDKAKKEAEDKAKKEAEDKAKKEAEDKAKKEAEDKAKKEAEDKAKKEAEKKGVKDKADSLKEGIGKNEGHLSDQASNFAFEKQHIKALQEAAQRVVAQAGKMKLNLVFFTLKNELENFIGKKGGEVLGCLKKNLENLPENRNAYTLMVEYMNRISSEGGIKWSDEEEKRLKERRAFFESKRAQKNDR